MKKLALILALAMLLGILPVFAAESAFTDVADTDWFAEAVDFCVSQGCLTGVGEGRFDPRGTVTRAMAVTALYRLAGSPRVTRNSGFADVAPEAWYASAVAWAARSGVVSGYDSGWFGAEDLMTREQLAAVLWRYAGSPEAAAEDFLDEAEISAYAARAVDWCRAAGVIAGNTDGRFLPKGKATRAELAQVLMRFVRSGAARGISGYMDEMDVQCAPAGIALTGGGILLVTDTYHGVVWQVRDGVSSVYAGSLPAEGEAPKKGYLDLSLDESAFASPWAIAPFLDGWAVSDPENNVVRLLRLSGVETVNAETAENLPTGDMGVTYERPTGLAADEDGNLYVADTLRGAIRRITPDGDLNTVAEGLAEPMGLAWYKGELYAAETGANRIVKIDAKGQVTVLAGTGEADLLDGPAASAAFAAPQALCVGEDGTIYVSDTANGAVRCIRNGYVTTLLAQGDGDADPAPVSPQGLLLRGDLLYVCDNFARKVFTISLGD